jgi:taurine dioxygenase
VLGSDTAIAVGMEEAKRFWQDLFKNSQVMHRSTLYDATKYKRIALRLGVVDKA